MTVRDLVSRSARLIGVLASGEALEASELQDAIASLQAMLDSWSIEGFVVPAYTIETFTLQNKAAHTMGPSGDFDTSRPVQISLLNILDNGSESEVEIIPIEDWAGIAVKSTTSTIPNKAYIEGTSPLETINFYPIPTGGNEVRIYSKKLLLSITNANTVITLPPGFERAIVYNHAIEMAPEYGKTVPNEVAAVAIESKANVMRINGSDTYMELDSALVGGRRFNIVTGS